MVPCVPDGVVAGSGAGYGRRAGIPARRPCDFVNGKGQALAAERWGNYPAVLAVTVIVVALALAGLAMLGREAQGQDMTVV